MALQDLTPQLRTRLSRMERAVGWFVILAMLLLGFGFVYYVYNTAERKGWFLTKAQYFTFVKSAAGLKVGDPVVLMGFDAGEITKIQPMPADQFDYNVYIQFELKSPNYGYIWTEGSQAKVNTADLLGKRNLEVTKGTGGYPTFIYWPMREVTPAEAQGFSASRDWLLGEEIYGPHGTNLLARPLQPLADLTAVLSNTRSNVVVLDKSSERKTLTGMWNDKLGRYDPYTNNVSEYWLLSDESPAVTEQLQKMVGTVEQALPNILNLTNQIGHVLSNSAELTSNLNVVALSARPVVSNLAAATAHLGQPGALGEWLLPTNINRHLEGTLTTASNTLFSVNTNLAAVLDNLNRSLDNLAGITSNLNQQVQANTNLLTSLSDSIVHADQFVQGLKRFWLFRHLFKEPSTNAPAPMTTQPLRSPKDSAP
jgi:ABC-type transporter Mla subunit MlaD